MEIKVTEDGIAKLCLLDTNILLALVRRGALGGRILARFPLLTAPFPPLISFVTEAEIKSIASRQKWGKARKNQLDFILPVFTVVHIHEPGVLEAYVAIDNYSLTKGVKMGKNDLWTAATASATAATLLTTDKDFDHLPRSLVSCQWIDPIV